MPKPDRPSSSPKPNQASDTTGRSRRAVAPAASTRPRLVRRHSLDLVVAFCQTSAFRQTVCNATYVDTRSVLRDRLKASVSDLACSRRLRTLGQIASHNGAHVVWCLSATPAGMVRLRTLCRWDRLSFARAHYRASRTLMRVKTGAGFRRSLPLYPGRGAKAAILQRRIQSLFHQKTSGRLHHLHRVQRTRS